jgi:hypothetical protein
MPKSNYSLPHEKIQRELATIKVEVNHIKNKILEGNINPKLKIALKGIEDKDV